MDETTAQTTAQRRAKKRKITYAGLAIVVAAALAVTLKERAAPEEDTRFSQVISDFINLSAAPDPRGLDFLSRDRTQRTIRADRLRHIDAGVLAAHADRLEITEDTLRAQIGDPNQTNAFDYTGILFDGPDEVEQGRAGPWAWAIMEERAEILAGETVELVECGEEAPCRVWLLYWDAETWYYAPVGTDTFNAALFASAPDLAEMEEKLE